MQRLRRALPFLLVLAALARPAPAAVIATAPLEEVLAHASHVVLGTWLAEGGASGGPQLLVERWLRGEAPGTLVRVHGVPSPLLPWVSAERMPGAAGGLSPLSGLPEGDALSRRGVLFLEALDGRLHLAGMRRYGARFGAHASVRAITRLGHVVAWQQVINPGGPVPVMVDERTWAAFEPALLGAVRKHPYAPTGPSRPPVASAQREAFFEALGPALDWYQGGAPEDLPGWASSAGDPQGVRGRVARLVAWMDGVAGPERLPGLEALLMLSRPREVGQAERDAILEAAGARMLDVPREQVQEWLDREVEHGRHGVDRRALARLARRLGPEAYERVLERLEAWVERTEVNEGSDCWFVLRELGEGAQAEAAAARRRAREKAPEGR